MDRLSPTQDRPEKQQKNALQTPKAGERGIFRACFAAVILASSIWMAQAYLVAVAWAAVLAIAIWPLYRHVRRRLPRPLWAAPLLVTVISALVLLAPVSMALTAVGGEAGALVDWLTRAQRQGLEVPSWVLRLPGGPQLEAWWRAHLSVPGGIGRLVG